MKKIFFLFCLMSFTSATFCMEVAKVDSQRRKEIRIYITTSIKDMQKNAVSIEGMQQTDSSNDYEAFQTESGEVRINIACNGDHEANKKELEKIKERQKVNALSLCLTGGISCLSAIGIFVLLTK